MLLKKQFYLIGGAIVLTASLYFLPKAVIKSKEEKSAGPLPSSVNANQHDQITQVQVNPVIDSLNSLYKFAEIPKNKLIFANQLAEVYIEASKFDSAAYYYAEIEKINSSSEAKEKAALTYYQAYDFAVDRKKKKTMALKAKDYFQKLSAENPNNIDYKVYLALIKLVELPNPMGAIVGLRNIADENPTNILAQMELGKLSLQSGQWKKAVNRFENVLRLNKDLEEAHFYLGVALKEDNRADEAQKYFQWIKENSQNADLLKASEQYLVK